MPGRAGGAHRRGAGVPGPGPQRPSHYNTFRVVSTTGMRPPAKPSPWIIPSRRASKSPTREIARHKDWGGVVLSDNAGVGSSTTSSPIDQGRNPNSPSDLEAYGGSSPASSGSMAPLGTGRGPPHRRHVRLWRWPRDYAGPESGCTPAPALSASSKASRTAATRAGCPPWRRSTLIRPTWASAWCSWAGRASYPKRSGQPGRGGGPPR